jgi:hypothetical protein
LREEIRLTTKRTVATQFDWNGAGVPKVRDVCTSAGVATDLAAVDAGFHTRTGVHVNVSGSPKSHPEKATC